jgi:cation:H+ antiporter
MITCLQFLLCAVVICYCGTRLSFYGDLIADKTGLGRNWVGLVLLATVTSLPELITAVSSVVLNDLPDLAVSGTIGSCLFNVLVIAALDLLSRKQPVSNVIHQGHMLSAAFGIVLLSLVAIDILASQYLPVLTWLNSIDPISLLYLAGYFFAMKLIYAYEKKRVQEFVADSADSAVSSVSLARAVLMFVINSCVIVAAACFLPALAEELAKMTGLGQSFIGSSLLAVTTSLPEIAVSVAAARAGSFDMAVANLLGSNLFNVAILGVTDIFYTKGPLLRSVASINGVTAMCAVMATAIVIIGLTYRSEKKFFYLAADAIAIIVLYAAVSILLFHAH